MSDDLKEPEWPREIWMAEREDHDQGVVSAVLSEWATVSRWEGDKERDRDFHRYVDADIYDSADKYWKARIEALEAQLAEATSDRDAAVAQALEMAAQHCVNYLDTYDNLTEIHTSIRALTPTDAAEALEAVPPDAIAQASADGMREAASIAERRAEVCWDADAKGLGDMERHCALEARHIASKILAAIEGEG